MLSKTLCGLVAISTLSIGASHGSAAEQTDIQGSDTDLEAFFDGLMAAQLQHYDVGAAVVAVVHDGETVFAKGYGHSDIHSRAAVDPDETLFRVGSISKLFTWTAIMQLVEKGEISLDDDVNEYLTRFQIPEAYDEPVRIRHLLTHTPGFEDAGLGFVIVFDETLVKPLAEALETHVPERVRPPGVYTAYSNFGTALAGLIVANVSGLSFEDYVEKNIFAPLGMVNSSFREPLPDDLAAQMATGYLYKDGAPTAGEFEILANVGPAGGLSATATDLARFMIAHMQKGEYEGARILTEESVSEMHKRAFALDPRLPGMALGFYEMEYNDRRLIGHAGDTIFFHSQLAIIPSLDMGIIVSYSGFPPGAREELLQALMDRYAPLPIEYVEPPEDFDGSRFAGSYKNLRRNHSTIEKISTAFGELTVTPSEDNTLIVAFGQKPQQYVEIEPLLFREVDGPNRLAFEENEDGDITHLFMDSLPFMPFERKAWYETVGTSTAILGLGYLLCITMMCSAVIRRKSNRTLSGPARWATRLSIGFGVLSFIVAVLSGIAVTDIAKDFGAGGMPATLTIALAILLVPALLSLSFPVFAVAAWRNGYWTWGRRVHYTLFALAAISMTWFYFHWNAIGFQY